MWRGTLKGCETSVEKVTRKIIRVEFTKVKPVRKTKSNPGPDSVSLTVYHLLVK